MNFNFYSINEINKFISENRLNIQRKFGQNFLVDEDIIKLIVDKFEIEKNDLVLEIGCGLGSLTNKLIALNAEVTGFELDNGYIKFLKSIFADKNNFNLVEGDFLKTSKRVFSQIDKNKYRNIILMGNLPYYITKEIFELVFTNPLAFNKYGFMIQKEVLEKVTAKPDDDKYCYMSILSQINKSVETVVTLSRNSFYPQPEVESVFVMFKQKEDIEIMDKKLFFRISKSLFLNRRKKLSNNIKVSPLLSSEEKSELIRLISKTPRYENIRGESLTLNEIAQLSNGISLTR